MTKGSGAAELVTVFSDGPGGGNPAPVVVRAADWTDAQMGHATLAAGWLLLQRGVLTDDRELRVHTLSGVVRARVAVDGAVSISQPSGTAEDVESEDVLAVLGLPASALGVGGVRNARTSRVKALVDVGDAQVLDALSPDWDAIERVCSELGSTGLYPYAQTGERQFDARQFPRSSGYPEDPATGIAAAALACALVSDGTGGADGGPVVVRQGRAMARPSRIKVAVEPAESSPRACWISGMVELS